MSSYLKQAILECERAIETKLVQPQVWQTAFKNLGNVLQGMGQFDAAICWHSFALEEQLDLGEVYYELGQLYLFIEYADAALKSFENALKYRPDSVRILSSLARVYAQLDRKDAEVMTWYRTIEIRPDFVNPSGYYKLGRALQEKDWQKAVNCYQQALSDKKFFILASYELARIYWQQNELEKAKSYYQQILAMDSTQAEAQYQLGTIYLQQQCLTEAIEYFQQTIDNAPEFPGVHYDLVKTYLRLQRWDEAIATCHAIINLLEPYPWVYSFLGTALRAKGNHADAAANFQRACQGRGWDECLTNDYFFSVDTFSERIPVWKTQLQPLLTGKKQIALLEIGTYQGMSACWLLDKVLVKPKDRLTCIEETCDRLLVENIAKTGSQHKVTILEGDISSQIASLQPESFDLINFQDRHKLADSIERNAILAWKLLKSGGIFIFNDYGWANSAYPQLNPTEGIERFLIATKERWKSIHHAATTFQLIIRKL
ncbi:tetratricopeptide repeat protein [Myxosarcina sp. GI1(2024)]